MSTISISYFKLDLHAQIIDYDENLVSIFSLGHTTKHQSIATIINSLNQIHTLKNMQEGTSNSMIIFCNSRINAAKESNSMLILYAVISKHADHYLIRITNWLNLYSRIRTNLKQEFNLDNFDAIDVIKNNNLLEIKYDNNIFVPNTVLCEDIVLPVEHDRLLVSIIESICPAH